MKMTREEIIASAEQFVENASGNYVSEEAALCPDYVGMRIFEAPIFAFGCVEDEIYSKFKEPGVIGGHFLSPSEWLPGAKTVVSVFLPYTERIRAANSRDFEWPADEWLHGRYEGHLFIMELNRHIHKLISDAGYECLIPGADPRFSTSIAGAVGEAAKTGLTSNWSERHAAFACGLGTFGLSKGLITKKGTSGRFGSVLTDLDLEKDIRRYNEVYEYCTMCNVCIPNCPVCAITKDGKSDSLCSVFLNKVHDAHDPRYGCGKCQVKVPCEKMAPGLRA